jgi:hypothetical protein
MNKPVIISVEDYEEAADNYQGWCPDCQAFTRGETEPDAENYPCEECYGRNVCGAEQALLIGMFELEE